MAGIDELRIDEIKYTQAAIDKTPSDHPNLPGELSNLGDFPSARYNRMGNMQDLEDAIKHAQAAVNTTPIDHPQLPGRLNNLGNRLSDRYDRMGNIQDLEDAIKYTWEALDKTPSTHPNLATISSNLGNLLSDRYDRTGNIQDLEDAIKYTQAVIDKMRSDHPNLPGILDSLGGFLSARYKRTGNMQDLENAIKHAQAAVNKTPSDHPSLPGSLNNLGNRLSDRYNRMGNMEDLENAIKHTQAAVNKIPSDHPGLPGSLSNLGNLLSDRYNRTGNMQDLEDAITHAQAAVNKTPSDHPGLPGILNNLGTQLRDRYQRTGNMQDLEDAIKYTQAAIDKTPSDHPSLPGRLSNLGNQLGNRCDRMGNMQDLEDAIKYTQAAVNKTPTDHPDLLGRLGNLANHLSDRYDRMDNIEDLEDAIKYAQDAVNNTPSDHPDLPDNLNKLGSFLCDKYDRMGNMQDLEDAIKYTREALDKAPSTHPGLAIMLSNFGRQLHNRYDRTGNMQDLEDTIKYIQAIVNKTPTDHPNLPGCLGNLGAFLNARYYRMGNIQDLEDAIEYTQAAINKMPSDHPNLPSYLGNLGNCLHDRYDRMGNMEDLEDAIKHAQAAINKTPSDHPNLPSRLNNLGSILSARYKQMGNMQDLEDAIKYTQAAVDKLPSYHPDSALQFSNLGDRYLSFAQYPQALLSFLNSWECINSPLLQRLRGAFAASRLQVYEPATMDLPAASSLLSKAVQMIPLLTGRSLSRDDQQHILRTVSGLTSLAASVILRLNQSPTEAVRVLELGRNITNGQLLDYRSDISLLTENHLLLAEKFNALRLELDSPLSSESLLMETASLKPDLKLSLAITRRDQAAKELEGTIQQIRQQPGFEEFLLPPSSESLMSAAHHGPIVVLNVTKLCSHAILVTKENITSLPLPHLSHEDVIRHLGSGSAYTTLNRSRMRDIGNRGLPSQNDGIPFKALLGWLWNAVVEPVLSQLQLLTDGSSGPLPQIWWIGVGPMAHAPLHAAGDFRTINERMSDLFTLRYCIPLYTPSIRALIHARAQAQDCVPNRFSELSALVVAMPTTPGLGDLGGVQKEVNSIVHEYKKAESVSHCKIDTSFKPTAENILEKLESYSIIHFACHGISTENPADSHLVLSKPCTTPFLNGVYIEEADKLCVRDIAAKRLKSGRLAFLSACSTAYNKAEYLADETTHMASSFQIAGFHHVIGTLWPADDKACVMMARSFYSSLLKTNDVAVAYRNAIMKLRKHYKHGSSSWAPFILLGA